MDYPNKIYVFEAITNQNMFEGRTHYVVTIAASSIEVAKQYAKNLIGIDVEPMCLTSAVYPTIYVSNGSVPKTVQAKILANKTFHADY